MRLIRLHGLVIDVIRSNFYAIRVADNRPPAWRAQPRIFQQPANLIEVTLLAWQYSPVVPPLLSHGGARLPRGKPT